MRLLLGFTVGSFVAHYYSRPQADGTHYKSYVVLRDSLYKPVKEEISKNENRAVMKTVFAGVKAYVRSLF